MPLAIPSEKTNKSTLTGLLVKILECGSLALHGEPMTMFEGQIFRCQNRGCGCEVRVIKVSVESGQNPRCCCGAEMKKPYTPPGFRELKSEVLTNKN